MNGPNLSDAVVGRLAAVLARVLETGSSESSVPSEPGGPEMRRLALSGATAVLPAVLALQQLQERVRAHDGADSWNGLLHRRCLMILSGSGEAASEAFQNSPGPSLRRIVHAEWELIRAVVEVRVGGRQSIGRQRRSGGNSRNSGPDLIRPTTVRFTVLGATTSPPGRRPPVTVTPSTSYRAGRRGPACKSVLTTSWLMAFWSARSVLRSVPLPPGIRPP